MVSSEAPGRHALTRMLAVALDLPIVDSSPALMATKRGDLLEILVRVFAENLLAAVRRGLPHRYRQFEDDLPLLRGKLDVRRQITRHDLRTDRMACAFDELSVDTPLNRMLKGAVRRVVPVARTAANRRRLQELTARFESVSESTDPLGEPVWLDRTNTAFPPSACNGEAFSSGRLAGHVGRKCGRIRPAVSHERTIRSLRRTKHAACFGDEGCPAPGPGPIRPGKGRKGPVRP